MTVAELIAALSAYPSDMPVVVSGDEDGSHWCPPALDRSKMAETEHGWFIAGPVTAEAIDVLRL